MAYTRSTRYLRDKCGDRYRTTQREDGIWYILTRHKPDAETGLEYDVYVYNDELLAACLPRTWAKTCMRTRSGVFTVHQEGTNGMVLLFKEELLHGLAQRLKLWKRRKLSEARRAKLVEVGAAHRFQSETDTGVESL